MREIGLEDVAVQLAYARQVVFVPGYGMATAQAQHVVRNWLKSCSPRRQRQVAIHPSPAVCRAHERPPG